MTSPPARVVSSCIRIELRATSDNAVAATSMSIPSTPATASAAAALTAMWAPLTPRATGALPHGVCTSKRGRARSSRTNRLMRTSAASSCPNVMTPAAVRTAIAATRSSSALRIAVPVAGRASISSPLARATPSMPPTRSVCAGATDVTTPMSGRPTAHNRAISPKPRMPISSTRTSVSAGAARIVTGRPCSLLKLRSFAATRRPAPTAARTKSLVLVLPTLPVMPTTVAGSSRRAHAANAISAAPVSATSTTVIDASTGREASVAGAPASAAAATNSWPSRAATRGTNSWPGTSARESNEAPSRSTSGPRNVPPVASATSDARILTAPNGTVPSMAADRIHLVVLFGGQSAEHDVSCVTAAHVLAAVDPAAYRITSVGITRDGQWQLADGAREALQAGPAALTSRLETVGSSVSPEAVLGQLDEPGELTVVLPLLHGPMGEDGTVQGLLELADVAYVGAGVLGSALAMDKAMAKQVLGANGIAQSRYRAFAEHETTPGLPNELVAELGLPCFVKPSNMGSSVGVSKAHTVEELRDAIELALTYDEWVVVEEAVTCREIEVGILGGIEPLASGPGEIVPGAEFYDYEDKYVTDGAQLVIPAPLTPAQTEEVRALAVRVFEVLRCDGLARIDFLFEEGGRGFLCNEANTIPGFTPVSMYPKLWEAAGVSYPELIDRLVHLALERHGRRRRNTKH